MRNSFQTGRYFMLLAQQHILLVLQHKLLALQHILQDEQQKLYH